MLKFSEPVSVSSVPKFHSVEPWFYFEELLKAELAKKHVWYLFTDASDEETPFLDASLNRLLVQIQQGALYQPPDTIDIDGLVTSYPPTTYSLSYDQIRAHSFRTQITDSFL